MEGDYNPKKWDYQHQVISGLWWLVRVRESRTVSQMTEPLSDRWRVRESRTVESVKSWQTWYLRVRESRTLEGVKTPHHPWQSPHQPSPKLLSVRPIRAHWLDIKLNTPANKARPRGSKPNKLSMWELQRCIKHKR